MSISTSLSCLSKKLTQCYRLMRIHWCDPSGLSNRDMAHAIMAKRPTREAVGLLRHRAKTDDLLCPRASGRTHLVDAGHVSEVQEMKTLIAETSKQTGALTNQAAALANLKPLFLPNQRGIATIIAVSQVILLTSACSGRAPSLWLWPRPILVSIADALGMWPESLKQPPQNGLVSVGHITGCMIALRGSELPPSWKTSPTPWLWPCCLRPLLRSSCPYQRMAMDPDQCGRVSDDCSC